MRTLCKFLVILVFCANANAALVQWDAFSAGDNLAVKDEETGIIWLDLSQSAGIGYFQAGDWFDDWGYADNSQVENLLATAFPSYGVSHLASFQNNCLNGQTCFEESQNWLALFGATANILSDVVTYGFGLYSDEDDLVRLGGARINANPRFNNAYIYGDEFTVDYTGYTNAAPTYYYSTFLTFQPQGANPASNPVPAAAFVVSEPVSTGLFGLMLMFMGITRKRTIKG